MADTKDEGPAPLPGRSYPELISLAVHELRTPASVVGGYLRMLQRDPSVDERHRKMIDEAAKSCARMVELIAELSDVGKMDAAMTSIAREPLDWFSLIGKMAAGVHEAEDRGVRLEVQGPETGAPVAGDLNRLAAAIDAILRAILREQPPEQTIVAERRLEADRGRPVGVLVVAEAGRVQSSYEAAPAPFDETRGGLGLKLPMARRVIEAHGGRIWSPAAADEDESAGRGAAVVVLPLELSR